MRMVPGGMDGMRPGRGKLVNELTDSLRPGVRSDGLRLRDGLLWELVDTLPGNTPPGVLARSAFRATHTHPSLPSAPARWFLPSRPSPTSLFARLPHSPILPPPASSLPSTLTASAVRPSAPLLSSFAGFHPRPPPFLILHPPPSPLFPSIPLTLALHPPSPSRPKPPLTPPQLPHRHRLALALDLMARYPEPCFACSQCLEVWDNLDISPLVFGNGDGGGGPLPKMLENLRRMRAMSNTHRELPPVSMGRPRGELDIEFHRGTYNASIKKGNRHCEILRDVERVATPASLCSGKYVYPQARITECREKVCLNYAFPFPPTVLPSMTLLPVVHDATVLPGSAITMAYDDAEKLYDETLCWAALPLRAAISSRTIRHSSLAARSFGCSGSCGVALEQPITEAWGYRPVSVYTNGADHFVLRNANVQLSISKGRITSLVDVVLKKELIQESASGRLAIFEDRPNFWNAWDVETHHLKKATPFAFTNVSVVAQGSLRASVRAEIKYGQSNIAISLDAFPASTQLDSRSLSASPRGDTATYETQFGHVQRPTHKNTTWDMAKCETNLLEDIAEGAAC
ncbi:hypothetical protein B0H14DRAFT_3454982 [Mycena olivaceomarginata]|nr:hypothetical protein B0H14DRAFT_3454982 [Mycena olivaceomarginata]